MFEKLIEKKKQRGGHQIFQRTWGSIICTRFHALANIANILVFCAAFFAKHIDGAPSLFSTHVFLDIIETCLLYKNLSTEEEKKNFDLTRFGKFGNMFISDKPFLKYLFFLYID